MAILQRFDEQKGNVFVVWKGVVTAEEWFSKAERLASHPRWPGTPRVLADLLPVTDTSSIQEQEIEHAAGIFARNWKSLRGKKVAVLAKDEFARARYFADLLVRFGFSMVVFNNLDTACLFLGIDVVYAYRELDELRRQMA